VEPAVIRWTTPVGVIVGGGMAMALVRLNSKEAVKAIAEVIATMMNFMFKI